MQVFISYARKDRLLCDAVMHTLEGIGNIESYRDTSPPMPGVSLSDRFKMKIASCDLFVVLLTENSITSTWVTTEVAWAISNGKYIIPVLQVGRNLNEVPSLRSDLEYIKYDPTDYEPTLDGLRNFVEKARKETTPLKCPDECVVRKETIATIDRLNSEDILNLLSLKSEELVPPLVERLVQNAKATLSEFFTDPRYGSFVNVGTLATDAKVIITRWDTLHALLRAAQKANPSAFRRAGYEAGSLYGIGVIKWFLEKSATKRGKKGLPRDSFSVLEACAKIDNASGWGKIEVTKTKSASPTPSQGWNGVVTIKDHFLAHEIMESKTKDASNRYANYKAFWKGYLEGSYSAALGAWYGIWTSEGGEEEFPLFVTYCEEHEIKEEADLVFDLYIRYPIYNATFVHLQRELFCPYLRDEKVRIVARARGVVESFIRELAGVESSQREDMVQALTWLGQNADDTAKGAAAYLAETRNFLHSPVHDVSREPTEGEARRILRLTSAAIFIACRDIRLDDKMKSELRSALLHRNVG